MTQRNAGTNTTSNPQQTSRYLLTITNGWLAEDVYLTEAKTAAEAIRNHNPDAEIIDDHPRAAAAVYECAFGHAACVNYRAVAFDPTNQTHAHAAARAQLTH